MDKRVKEEEGKKSFFFGMSFSIAIIKKNPLEIYDLKCRQCGRLSLNGI